MPTTYILAGPNGAGKTSLYDWLTRQGFIPGDVPFINVDNIARFELRSYSEEASA